MVEVTQETLDQLESLADDDEEFQSLTETFKENYEEFEEKSDGLDGKQIEEFALRKTRTNYLSANRIPTDHIQMLTIGGSVRNTNNGDMFFGTAVVDTDPENDNVSPQLGSVRIFDEDLSSEVYNAFDGVGNIVTGEFAVSDGNLEGHIEVSDSDDTEFEVTRPDNRKELVEEIRDIVPETNIANITDNLTSEVRNEDGDIYPVSSDISRITVDIYDAYKNENDGYGIYTVRDDTVFDDEDVVESDVFNADEANENATPGLTCWVDPSKMEYGSESTIEMYGTLTTNEDSEVTMNVDGMIPVPIGLGDEFVTEFDGYEDEGEPSPDDVDTSNVDRTTI